MNEEEEPLFRVETALARIAQRSEIDRVRIRYRPEGGRMLTLATGRPEELLRQLADETGPLAPVFRGEAGGWRVEGLDGTGYPVNGGGESWTYRPEVHLHAAPAADPTGASVAALSAALARVGEAENRTAGRALDVLHATIAAQGATITKLTEQVVSLTGLLNGPPNDALLTATLDALREKEAAIVEAAKGETTPPNVALLQEVRAIIGDAAELVEAIGRARGGKVAAVAAEAATPPEV